jgi:hypothetical protein
MPSAIICYVSGHGFGHAARVCEVLRVLRARRPDLAVVIRSPLGRWFFDFNLDGPFTHGECRLDVGVVQADSLTVDLEATRRAYAAIDSRAAALVDAELAAVAPLHPALIFADIPALAFDVAARLGVPGVAMTNFSWDWIYTDYAGEVPAFAPLVASLRASYARAALLLRLPMHGDLSAFPVIHDIPLVARRASVDAATVRARLELPRNRRVVLLSFGGLGLELDAAPDIPGVCFVCTGGAAVGGAGPAGCRAVTHDEMTRAGLRYQDLVAACDAVLTKPGYGIVAECIANATPIVYTSRGRFAEYPYLVAGIEAQLPSAFIDNESLRAGRWAAALDAAWAQPRRVDTVPCDGAGEAAAELTALAGPAPRT